ncbi:MAG: alpha-mannosidase [Clostridiales bacterium]|nr:alpha-mannosidase [Clostridiales bacterium]
MKLHMIGNAHLDPVWFWQWTEGYQEVKSTFRSALDRMKEYPDFIFTCAAASYYEWIEQDEPEMFEEIRQRVAEGRWCIVGGWWVQPDLNAPAGESFARHGLISQLFFESRFGKKCKTGYNVDGFGQSAMLPQIHRLSGMDNYVFMRPGFHEKEIPSNIFVWESPDGSRVKTFRIPVAYCTWENDLRQRMIDCMNELPKDAPDAMVYYGVGNHGGGPTKVHIESILRLKDEMNAEFSSPDRFFDTLDADTLPVVKGELFHHASGCYSAHSGVKKWNRLAENGLLAAEKWNVLSGELFGRKYPAEKLTQAWKRTLFNQFHDILAGTSSAVAYEDARNHIGEALSIAQETANSAMQTLSWRINVPFEEDTFPLVVFNPHAFDARIRVDMDHTQLPRPLFDMDGNCIPCQHGVGNVPSEGRVTLLFETDVPAMGYRLLTFRKNAEIPAQPEIGDSMILENEFIRAEISPETGFIKSIIDKATGTEALSGESSVPVVINDPSDTWSHGVTKFDEEIGRFTLKKVERTENGPVRSSICAEYEWGKSTIIQTFSLWHTGDQIEVKFDVNWQEGDKMLKLEYLAAGSTAETCAEIPYGMASRPTDGIEYPMQNWVRTGEITVMNDGKFAYDALENRLRLTILRSPRFANHCPMVCKPEDRFPYTDQGWQTIKFSICPRALAPMEACKRGLMLNQPPFVLRETFHDGPLPAQAGYVKVDGAILTALKRAEDASGDIIVHLYEANGEKAEVRLTVFDREFSLSLNPFEIAALRIPKNGDAYRVDLLEEKL